MMIFAVKYFIKWVIQGWILARLAKRVRKWLVKKYNLEGKFKETVTNKKDIDWKKIKWYAELAGYIYKENDDIKKKYKSIDKDIYINEINEIKYCIISDKANQSYYISIRGTKNSHNAMQDINFFKDKSFRLGIELHTGFHRTAEMIADDIMGRLDKTWDATVTGHSLGGAEAVIVSWYLDYAGFKVSECITYGQPKVTDSHGIRNMRGRIKLTRVVNETDVVALVPPTGTHRHRYAHGGTLIKLLDHGKYCHLEEPDSLNFGVNSFWLFAAREDFSFWEVGKELPDHYMTSYIENISKIIKDGDEVKFNERLKWIEDHGMLGEFTKNKKKKGKGKK